MNIYQDWRSAEIEKGTKISTKNGIIDAQTDMVIHADWAYRKLEKKSMNQSKEITRLRIAVQKLKNQLDDETE